ncbi:cholera enterotoxin subunit A2 [Beauveria bassiana ARSEF 2860]|uniref:Cholera enterotoxin subunit A2 n=1 Tax=Beauveria bassiana (strain ARSEF 2860) TaxID=655819 RepID=J5JMF1_BEAB2|nr:cholera enterotoxin subunit A2 [Beauveria bassiana ARSEF 2860]EJP64236.1 cholera enterotoxin subunit A2 [Beauveria bassiana ARSEF 2860]
MMNPMNWATAALAFAVSVQGAALPAASEDLHGRAEPLPTVVYRGSGSSPDSIKERGGFIPRARNESEPVSNTTFGLQSHHIGERRTMYTSTTRSVLMGATFALQTFEGGWVYKIHPTPNMIDLNESGFEIRFKREEEFSALGGVRWDQIEAWAEVTYNGLVNAGMHPHDVESLVNMDEPRSPMPPLNFTANPDYDAKKYDGQSASPGQPQLAGDDANLAKYNEKTLEGYAIEFMEKNGGPVGFDGKFPLGSLKTDAPAEPTTAREIEDKLCSNSDEEFGLTTADCRTQVAQCVCEEGNKPNFDWSLITACIKANLRLV